MQYCTSVLGAGGVYLNSIDTSLKEYPTFHRQYTLDHSEHASEAQFQTHRPQYTLL